MSLVGKPARPADSSSQQVLASVTVRSVFVEQTVRAPLERVWRACTEIQGLAAWQADEITGVVARGSELRLRWPSLGVAIELQVNELEPMHRIVFQSDDSELELKIAADKVSIEHRADFDEDEREGTL